MDNPTSYNSSEYVDWVCKQITSMPRDESTKAIIQDRDYFKRMHYMLWDWMSHNPHDPKKTWPGFTIMIALMLEMPVNCCFVCGWTNSDLNVNSRNGICEDCDLMDVCQESELHYSVYYNSTKRGEFNTAVIEKIRDVWNFVDSFPTNSKCYRYNTLLEDIESAFSANKEQK